MHLLLENSLFTNAAEKDTLMSNNFRLMDAFTFSFLGFIGLYQINDKAPLLMQHIKDEKKLVLIDIKDENNDASLIVKMCQQAKIIPQPFATKMIVMMRNIKMRALSGADIKDSDIRDMLSFSRSYATGPIKMLLDDFINNNVSLAVTTSKLYALARSPKFATYAGEFFNLARKGGYSQKFHEILKDAKSPAAPDMTQTPGGPSVANNPVAAQKPDPIHFGPHIYKMILDIKSEKDAKTFFSENNLTSLKPTNSKQQEFPWFDFLRWFSSNGAQIIDPVKNISRYGIFTQAPATYKAIATSINITNHWHKTKHLIQQPDAFVRAWSGFDMIHFKYLGQVLQPTFHVATTVVDDRAARMEIQNAFQFLTVDAIKDMKRIGVRTYAQQMKAYTDLIYNLMYGRESQFQNVSILDNPIWGVDPLAQTILSSQIFDEVVNKQYKCNPIANNRMRGWLLNTLGVDEKQVVDTNSDMTINVTRTQYESLDPDVKWFVDIMQKAKTLSARSAADQGKNALYIKVVETDVKRQAIELWSTADIKNNKFVIRFAEDLFSLGTKIRDLDEETMLEIARAVIAGMPGGVIPILDSTRKSQIGVFDVVTEFILKMVLKVASLTDGLGPEALYKAIVFASQSPEYKKKVYEQLLRPNTNAIKTIANYVAKYSEGLWAVDDDTFGEIVDILVERQSEIELSSFFLRMVYERLGVEEVVKFKIKDPVLAGDVYFAVKNNPKMQTYCTELFTQYPILQQKAIIYFKSMRPDSLMPVAFINGAFNAIHIIEPDDDITGLFRSSFENIGEWKGETGRRDDYAPNKAFLKIFDEEVRKKAKETTSWPSTLTYLGPCLDDNELNDTIGELSDEGKLFTGSVEEGKHIAQFLHDLSKRKAVLYPEVILKLAKQINQQLESDILKYGDIKSCIYSLSNIISEAFLYGRGTDHLEQVFEEFPDRVKAEVISLIGSSATFLKTKDIINKDIIAPIEPITEDRIPKILEYNRIQLPRQDVTSIKDIFDDAERFNKSLKPLAVKSAGKSKLDMLQKTVEYDAFNRYKHGEIGVEFVDEFDVDLPGNRDAYEQFLRDHPNTEFVKPAFHGTGSIAASFILRYGFTVVPSGAAGVVGRMLGDGIYFTDVLDKASQYVSDAGFSRGVGQEGYLFEMVAALGEKGVDYQSAGLGPDSTYHYQTVSPEWAVINPHSQLWVKKVYKIKLHSKKGILDIRKKLSLYESNVTPIIQFREYLGEAVATGSKNSISYLFMDGEIPVSPTKRVPFDKFDVSKYGGRVSIQTSQLGPVVRIETDDEPSAVYAVRFSHTMATSESSLNRFLRLLDKTTSDTV